MAMIARPALLFSVALFALAGCAREIYYRQGVSAAAVQAEETACALSAIQQAPVKNETRIYPGEFVPPERICRDDGSCFVVPGFREPPEIVTIDVNASERRLLERSCMAAKGYTRVTLPVCDEAVQAQVPSSLDLAMPALANSSCVVPRGKTAYQVVTPVRG
ncbi:hypothetical protein [Pseudooceanicola sp. C21-150M6]|uniref:hypothetical protein n=1 Tax=Pseudooceanicola sp. C21-150M6 TaxID=3434355 RepID=UPI003D7FFF62